MFKITERQMLVTLATMAIKMDDLTGEDILDTLRQLGHGNVIEKAREADDVPAAQQEEQEEPEFIDLEVVVEKARAFVAPILVLLARRAGDQPLVAAAALTMARCTIEDMYDQTETGESFASVRQAAESTWRKK